MLKRNICITFLSLLLWLFAGFNVTSASETDGTIPANSYAWGENIGWVDFGQIQYRQGNFFYQNSACGFRGNLQKI